MSYFEVHVSNGRVTIIAHELDKLFENTEDNFEMEEEFNSLCG